MTNLNADTPLHILFEEAYSRCESLDKYKKETLTDHIDRLKKQFDSTFEGGDDYCGTYPDKARQVITGALLSTHKTITDYIAADKSLDMFIPKPDLTYLKRVTPEDYGPLVDLGTIVPYPNVKEYTLMFQTHLYEELEEAIEYVESLYSDDPVIISRMLRHLEVLYIKEGKRLDGTDADHYSMEDRYGYNHIALQLDAVLAATKSLFGAGLIIKEVK